MTLPLRAKKLDTKRVFSLVMVSITFVYAWFFLFVKETHIVSLPAPVDGVSDARGIDLQKQLGRVSREWEFYPEQLYTTEDFASGDVIEPQFRDDIPQAYKIPYGTYRIVLQLDPEMYYSICGYSLDYGMEVFVNGYHATSVGTVADNAEDAVARVNYINFPVYTGDTGVVELVMHYSNFVHKEGGSVTTLTIGSPEMINRYLIDENLVMYLMSGGLLLLSAYYLQDSILRRKRVPFQLAMCCILFALRDQQFYIMHFIPWDYNWEFHYCVVVAIVALSPMAILTLIESIFPKLVNWKITTTYVALTLLGVGLMFEVPTQNVVMVSAIVQIMSIPYLAWLLFCLVKYFWKKKYLDTRDVLTIMSVTVLISANIIDATLNDNMPSVTRAGITPIGTILFIILFMTVLSMQLAEDEIALLESQKNEEALAKTNMMKTEFLQRMAHELRTPLTVMSGYAQLTNIQIETDEVSEETMGNLKVISSEAKRLSEIVSSLMELPTDIYGENNMQKVSVADFLNYTSIVCNGFLSKNNNELEIVWEKDYYMLANMEMLLQVMINLVINANKHTKDGKIIIKAKKDILSPQKISFYVEDNGCGIEEKALKQIFTAGYSTTGTKGLGLSICREIVELHSGEIFVVKTNRTGTIFKFTIMEYTEEKNG